MALSASRTSGRHESRKKPVLRTGPRPRHHPSCWSGVGRARPAAGRFSPRSMSCHVPLDPAAPIGRSLIGRCRWLALDNIW